jgi:hypothetical protein
MDTNSETLFAARRAEHHIRLRESERRRDAEQAAGIQPTHLSALPPRGWMSAALLAAGERLHRKITTESLQAEAVR